MSRTSHEIYGELLRENDELRQKIYDLEKESVELFKNKLNAQISNLTESLACYRKKLEDNPNSLFYRGSIKNAEELIEELRIQLEKNL